MSAVSRPHHRVATFKRGHMVHGTSAHPQLYRLRAHQTRSPHTGPDTAWTLDGRTAATARRHYGDNAPVTANPVTVYRTGIKQTGTLTIHTNTTSPIKRQGIENRRIRVYHTQHSKYETKLICIKRRSCRVGCPAAFCRRPT